MGWYGQVMNMYQATTIYLNANKNDGQKLLLQWNLELVVCALWLREVTADWSLPWSAEDTLFGWFLMATANSCQFIHEGDEWQTHCILHQILRHSFLCIKVCLIKIAFANFLHLGHRNTLAHDNYVGW
jgi:hypothetical protein